MHILAAIVLFIWILMFIQTIANLRAVPHLRADQSPNDGPLVSIVIPARNEARIIERSVRAFLAQDYENFEVIVVNDRSTDATGEILRAFNDPRLTVIDGSDTPAGWLGKPWALEQATARAQGELLLIVDADLIYAPEALRAAVAELERSGAAMLTLFPNIEMKTFAEQVAMPMMAFFAYCGLPLWSAHRTKSARVAMGGGSGNLIRRSVLQSIGGFAALKNAVVDDIALARLARHHGEITRIARADDLVTVRMYHGGREVLEGFTKNTFTTLNRNYVVAAVLMALSFVLHLFPYVFAFTGDSFAIATVILISATRVILFRSLGYRLDNAIFLHPLMVGFWAYIFLRSMWITGVRNELRWRGRVYDAAATRFGAEQ